MWMRKDKCPLCGGIAIVNLDGLVVGFLHLVNCEVMRLVRGEGDTEELMRRILEYGKPKDVPD